MNEKASENLDANILLYLYFVSNSTVTYQFRKSYQAEICV